MLGTVGWYRYAVDVDVQPGAAGDGGGHIAITSTLRDRTPVPQAEPLEEAEVIWGKPSNFSWGSRAVNFSSGPFPQTNWSTSTSDTEETDEPPDLTPAIDEWTEVSRVERDVRITGTAGAYVDFKRLDEVTFQLPDLPDGRQHFVKQVFKKFGDENGSA